MTYLIKTRQQKSVMRFLVPIPIPPGVKQKTNGRAMDIEQRRKAGRSSALQGRKNNARERMVAV
jgi:hypothetical protein